MRLERHQAIWAELREHGVDAIEAGTRHQPDVVIVLRLQAEHLVGSVLCLANCLPTTAAPEALIEAREIGGTEQRYAVGERFCHLVERCP